MNKKLYEIERSVSGGDNFDLIGLVDNIQEMIKEGYNLETIRNDEDGIYEVFTFVFKK